jgi:hypothetical protein
MSAERAPMRLVREPTGSASLESWLEELGGALRGCDGEAGEIREELESHLHERVRDLEIGGVRERDAVRQALAEVGDAGDLARRYHEARRLPRRRLLMNLSLLTVTGAVVAVGVVAASRPDGEVRVSVFEAPAVAPAENDALARRFDVNYREVGLGDALQHLGELAGIPVTVAWASLEDRGINADTPVTLADHAIDVPGALRQLSDQFAEGAAWRLGYRVQGGKVRVATEEYFDRREVMLASYDIAGINGATGETVVHLIQTFVHPEGWIDAGGDMAKVSLAGSKMFVEAPRRYHAEVTWLVNELRSGDQAGMLRDDRDQEAAKFAADAKAALADEHARQDDLRARLERSTDEFKRLADENQEFRRQLMAGEQERQRVVGDMAVREEVAKRQASAAASDSAELRDQLQQLRRLADELHRQCAAQQTRADVLTQTMDQQAIDARKQIDALRDELEKARAVKKAAEAPEVQVLPLKHVAADQVAAQIRVEATKITGLTAVTADPRTNSLVLQGDRGAILQVKELILRFDRPANTGDANPAGGEAGATGSPASK